MRALTVIGTAAMFLVGGGILTHGIAPLHHAIEHAAALAGEVALAGGLLQLLTSALLDALVGICGGSLALLGLKTLAATRTAIAGAGRTAPRG